MTTEKTDEKQEHLISLLKKFNCGMLHTQDLARRIVSRPMMLAGLDEEDGTILLVTADESKKVNEVLQHPSVNFSCQEGTSRFVSVSGTARVEEDSARLDDLWNLAFETWFPEGPFNSSAVLIVLSPEFGEYWDAGGVQKVEYIYEAAKAYASGSKPQPDEDMHAKLVMGNQTG